MLRTVLLIFFIGSNYAFTRGSGPIIYPDQAIGRARPNLSGPELIISKPHIVVHYTLEGDDSTTAAYAESVAVYAETSWVRTERFGWYMPAPDGNDGGDSLFDFYIECYANIGYPGLTWPDDPYTDPFTDGYTAYTEISSEVTDFNYLMSLTAHEFHHGAQRRYSAWEAMWWYENTSVFMEDMIFDHVNNLYGWLAGSPSPLMDPYCAIEEDQGAYEYAAALWATFLHEYYGMSCLLYIWDRCGHHSGNHSIDDMNEQLVNYFDSDLEKALGHYAIWRYFCGAKDIGDHFEEGGSYPSASILRSHSAYPAIGDQGTEPLDSPGGCNFIEFTNFSNYWLDIYFAGESDHSWNTYVLGVNTNDSFNYEYKILLDAAEDTGSISIPCWEYNTIVLVPVNTTWESNADNLDFDYEVALVTSFENIKEVDGAVPLGIRSVQNPAHLPVRIEMTMPHNIENTVLNIFDITGAKIKTFNCIEDVQYLEWDGHDNKGRLVPDGIYFCVLDAGNQKKCTKMMLIK